MNLMTKRPLLITPGEPAGIGAEIALKAWQSGITDLCLIDEPAHIERTATALGMTPRLTEITDPVSFDPNSHSLQIIPISWTKPPVAGAPDAANAPQVIDSIQRAAIWAQADAAAGIVTNPIQ